MGSTLQYYFWLHPEWWTLGLAGAAWAAMLRHAWQQYGHGVHHRLTPPQEVTYWLLMVAAMMLPVLVDTVRVTAAASLWARRHRAIAGFLLGYFVPWLGLGIAAAALRQTTWSHTYAAPALCFAAAALWQRTVTHKRALTAGHRMLPLAPVGWRADRDCLRFGSFIGAAHLRTCWPLMLACGLAGHSLIAMAGGMILGVEEHRAFQRRRRSAAAFRGALAMASYYAVLAFWELGRTLLAA